MERKSAGARGPLELVHHHPGRLRVRADVFRQDLELVARVRETIVGLAGITSFTHSARTGSLLVEYEPGFTEPDEVVEQIAEVANLERPDEDAVRARRRPPAVVAVGVARELNSLTMELTGSKVDLRFLVPTAIAAVSAYSFVYSKEPRLPRWDNLLYWSYNLFTSLHRREIDGPVRRPASLRPVPMGEREPQST
jgi:Heavy metal associated domain 2